MHSKLSCLSNLAFHSVYDEKLALKFDCVIESYVHHNFPMHIHDSLCISKNLQ